MEQVEESGKEAIRQTTGLLADLGNKLVSYLPTLLIGLFVFAVGMLIARLIVKIMQRTMKNAKIDKTASGFGQSLVRILLYMLLVIICLSILGVPMASIITVIGAAGVTVGLALQNSLSNLAGGFVLMFAKPFQAGDYIICGSQEGFVESVTTLYTELRTFDNRSIFLPNSIVSSGAVINLSRRGTLRFSIRVTVAYGADLKQTKDVLLAAAAKEKLFLQDPAPFILFEALADSGVELDLYIWVKKTDYFTGKSRAVEVIKEAFEDAGIEIPYPQVVVHGIQA